MGLIFRKAYTGTQKVKHKAALEWQNILIHNHGHKKRYSLDRIL